MGIIQSFRDVKKRIYWLLFESEMDMRFAVAEMTEEIEEHVEHELCLFVEHQVRTIVAAQIEGYIRNIVEREVTNLLAETRIINGTTDQILDKLIYLERKLDRG